jgi:hypothetical protein
MMSLRRGERAVEGGCTVVEEALEVGEMCKLGELFGTKKVGKLLRKTGWDGQSRGMSP